MIRKDLGLKLAQFSEMDTKPLKRTKDMKKKIIKRISIGLGLTLAAFGVYYGSIEYYLWKWESPHETLPGNLDGFEEKKTFGGDHGDTVNKIHAEMVEVFTAIQTTSLSGALAVDGDIIWAGAIGLADVENEVPATPESLYRIGSVSKPLTTVALAGMVEAGKIDLDEEIQTYLPDYPLYETPMTVRHLASHMAGVRHYGFEITKFPPTDFYSVEHYDDVIDALAPFKDDALEFNPGQGFTYSTHGYTLLSAVMQAAADKPFLDIMQDYVFDPVGLANIKAEDITGDLSGVVKFYNAEDGLYSPTPFVDLSNKWAGGGFVSTPTDLVKLGAALLGDDILDRQTRLEFMEPQPMFDGSENPQAYALGWRHHETTNILGEKCPVDVVHHGGKSSGGAAFFLLVPDHNITVAVSSNGVNDNTRKEIQLMAYRMAGLVLEGKGFDLKTCES
jgi:CubicO group peptidase (beta-lactamase class C family)